MSFKSGAGCTYCNLSGYRGRIAVYELLEFDRTLADAIRRDDLRTARRGRAPAARLCPLTQSALDLASAGVTRLAEAISVTSGLEEQEDLSGVTASWRSPLAAPSSDGLLDDAFTESA